MWPLHCYICVLNWKTREMAFACEDSDLSSSRVPLKQKTVPKRLPCLEAYYPLHRCWQSQDGQTPSEQIQIPWSPNQGVNVNSSQMSALKVLCLSPQLLPLHMLKSGEKTRNWKIVFSFRMYWRQNLTNEVRQKVKTIITYFCLESHAFWVTGWIFNFRQMRPRVGSKGGLGDSQR